MKNVNAIMDLLQHIVKYDTMVVKPPEIQLFLGNDIVAKMDIDPCPVNAPIETYCYNEYKSQYQAFYTFTKVWGHSVIHKPINYVFMRTTRKCRIIGSYVEGMYYHMAVIDNKVLFSSLLYGINKLHTTYKLEIH